MSVVVRKATKEDMPDVLELIKELAVFEKQPNAVQINIDTLVAEGFGNQPLFTCFVSLLEGQIVGMALCYFRFSTWKGRSVHLEDLIVKEKNRGIGAGFALYSEIIKQGKKDNVRRIEWNVLDWNTPAIEFYKKSGASVLNDWRVVHMDEIGINTFINNIEKTTNY